MDMKQRSVSEILASSHEPLIDGIIVIDANGIIRAFDSAAQTLFGYRLEEAVGQPLIMLMSKSQGHIHPNFINRALNKTNFQTHPLHIERTIIGKHKQGHSIPLAITVSSDTSSVDTRFTGVIQDLRKHEDFLTSLYQDFSANNQALNQRIDFEGMLNLQGNRLLSCSATQFRSAMEDTLQAIAQSLSLDHGYILQLSPELEQASLWSEWRRSAGLMKHFPNRFNIPKNSALFQGFTSTDTLVLEASDNAEDNILYDLAQQLSPNGFITTRITPIFSAENALVGCIGFSVLDSNHKMNTTNISLLNLATQLIINAWGRHQLIIRAHSAEEKIKAKNKLLANKAAFSQTLLRSSNTLLLSTRENIQHNIQESLLQAALISGHQNALLYFKPGNPTKLKSFIGQFLNQQRINPSSHPLLISFIEQALQRQEIIQLENIDNYSLEQELATELKLIKIQGFTAIKLHRAKQAIGFVIFYNALAVLSSNEENLRFLQLTGQNLAAAILQHSVQYELELSEKKLLSANKILAQQALQDALTNLPNRRAFDYGITQEFDRAKRHNSNLTLLMCDIDYFKHYNDYFGHPQGDVCLQQVAKILQTTFHRAGELCTRFGGEEFAILLPAISRDEAQLQAQRLIDTLLTSHIPHAPEIELGFVSLSIGIAQFSTRTAFANPSALIGAADKALYHAKNNGRNQLAWTNEAE